MRKYGKLAWNKEIVYKKSLNQSMEIWMAKYENFNVKHL